MKNYWKESEIQYLKENFEKMSKGDIAKILGRTSNAVQLKANKLGLKKPEKYFYTKRFFQNIDTEEKAYWLGFFFADGYTQNNLERRYREAAIMLSIKDIEHLRKLNKAVNGNIEVKTSVRGNGFGNGRKHEVCCIRFYSWDFVEDLIGHGCIPNKVKQMQFPELPQNLYWPFIRGYFDGDGCITLDNKRNMPKCDFASTSYTFLDALREFLYSNNICSYYTDEKSGVRRLNIRGLENCNLFLEKIYKNASVYLDRKYNKYIQYHQNCDIDNRIKNNKLHHKNNKLL